MTCSWDFTRAEEKEQEVQAAKAARGRARQQKAEKHSLCLDQQRQKAAVNLARLTALQPDSRTETDDHSTADGDDAANSLHSSGTIPHKASDRDACDVPTPMCDQSNVQLDVSQGSESQYGTAPGQYTGGSTEQESHLIAARSLPIAVSSRLKPALQQVAKMDDSDLPEMAQAGSGSLRRLASAAGYPVRQMTVPGPVLHSCAVESCRNSPSSMQSWQIVRPRPVQRDKTAVRRPSHVKVQT